MAREHIFKSAVVHGIGGKKSHSFVKGQECPQEFIKEMKAKGLVEPLPEPVRPVAPPKPDDKE